MEHEALIYAEKIGICEYVVNEDWIEYWSFFPGEGFRFVQRNLITGEENRDGLIPWDKNCGRPRPKFLINERGWTIYNYICG